MSASHAPQALTALTTPDRGAGITVRAPRAMITSQRWPETEPQPDPAHILQHLDREEYTHLPEPAVVVYRLAAGQHQQTGVVVETSVADYRNGRIRRHEATRPERVHQLAEFTEAAEIELMPVMLTHPSRSRLRALLAEITADAPDVCRTVNGITHTVWVRHDPGRMRDIRDEINHIDTMYIADGHHRMVSAQLYASRRSHLGSEHPSAYTLAALFPSDEMRILGYHRCLPLPEGTSPADVLKLLAAQPVAALVEECDSPECANPGPGIITVGLASRYFRVHLRAPREPRPIRTSLDAVALDEGLLPPLIDLYGSAPAACCCASERAIRFFPHPPSIEQIMAVADAGMIMPAKSTWFDPKPGAGLFLRELG